MAYVVIVFFFPKYPNDLPGDRRIEFVVVRSYVVWPGITVGGAELG